MACKKKGKAPGPRPKRLRETGARRSMRGFATTKPVSWLLMLGLLLLLTSCASVPSVPPICPPIPDLPAREQTGLNWEEAMQSFLQGSLPELRVKTQP